MVVHKKETSGPAVIRPPHLPTLVYYTPVAGDKIERQKTSPRSEIGAAVPIRAAQTTAPGDCAASTRRRRCSHDFCLRPALALS